MPDEESINSFVSDALEKLESALSEVLELSQNDRENIYQIGKLGRSIGLLREFQAPIYEMRPDLKPSPPWEGMTEPTLSADEEAAISLISKEQLGDIDDALVSLAGDQFQKVAKIVMIFMSTSKLHKSGIPDIFYGQRVEYLAACGRLEYQGNLKYMRYCEVRAPKT